jgi:hypothetical protein
MRNPLRRLGLTNKVELVTRLRFPFLLEMIIMLWLTVFWLPYFESYWSILRFVTQVFKIEGCLNGCLGMVRNRCGMVM